MTGSSCCLSSSPTAPCCFHANLLMVESPDRFARDLSVQMTGHDYLRSLGVELVPTSAPDFFTTDTPTAVLVRQVLGAVSQFEKANLIAKLRAARERKTAAGGRGSGRFAYAQKVPEVVALVRELHGQRQSLRQISKTLAVQGYLTGGGKPYTATAVQKMLRGGNGVRRDQLVALARARTS